MVFFLCFTFVIFFQVSLSLIPKGSGPMLIYSDNSFSVDRYKITSCATKYDAQWITLLCEQYCFVSFSYFVSFHSYALHSEQVVVFHSERCQCKFNQCHTTVTPPLYNLELPAFLCAMRIHSLTQTYHAICKRCFACFKKRRYFATNLKDIGSCSTESLAEKKL